MNEQEGRERLAAAVRRDRRAKYRTVEDARLEAKISRGAWDAVEKAKPVKEQTLTAVEKALGWETGRTEELLGGVTEDAGDLRALLAEVESNEGLSESVRDYMRRSLERDIAESDARKRREAGSA